MDAVSYQNLSDQYFDEEVWLDTHDQTRSVSAALANLAGNNYVQIPGGTIMTKCADGYHRPLASAVVSDAVAAAALVPLANGAIGGVPIELAFQVGDRLFIEGQTHSFAVASIDATAKTITLAEAVTIAEGAVVYVDPGVAVAAVNGAVGVAANAFVVDAGDDLLFRVRDRIAVAGITGERTITAIDTATHTITFSGATSTVADNAKVTVTGPPRGADQPLDGYKISCYTVNFGYGNGYNPGNVIVPCRTHGEVRRRNVKGFREALRARLPLIQWNNHTN